MRAGGRRTPGGLRSPLSLPVPSPCPAAVSPRPSPGRVAPGCGARALRHLSGVLGDAWAGLRGAGPVATVACRAYRRRRAEAAGAAPRPLRAGGAAPPQAVGAPVTGSTDPTASPGEGQRRPGAVPTPGGATLPAGVFIFVADVMGVLARFCAKPVPGTGEVVKPLVADGCPLGVRLFLRILEFGPGNRNVFQMSLLHAAEKSECKRSSRWKKIHNGLL